MDGGDNVRHNNHRMTAPAAVQAPGARGDMRNVATYLLGTPLAQRTAVRHGQQRVSHAELSARSNAMAAELAGAGMGRGDIVAIVGDNSVSWIVCYLAVLKCGSIALPLSGRESERMLRRSLAVSGLRCVLSEQRYADNIRALLDDPAMLWIDPATAPGADAAFDADDVPFDQPAAIMMTSGSTGDPKGVVVSHRNIAANTRAILSYLHLDADDRMMVVLPFCYCFGLSLLHTHLRVGGSVVLNNSFMFPQKVVSEMRDRQCTGFAGVPTTYMGLLARSKLAETALPTLRHVQQAGGRMPVAVSRRLRAALGSQVRVFVMYGATEATARMSYLPPACLDEKEGSIGVPVPGTRFELRGSDGKPVKQGEVGELVALGDGIALGYFEDAALTAKRFAERSDGARAFRTGDLARADRDGFYYIEGRQADFIKSYGVRVSPMEIEDVLLAHPDVADAAVFGLPGQESDEAIAACVVARRDDARLVESLREHCTRELPNHKVPQVFRLVTALPRNQAGKLQRAQLARCYDAGTAAG